MRSGKAYFDYQTLKISEMKKIITAALFSIFAGTAFAQTQNADAHKQHEHSIKNTAGQLLSSYYDIKDALVNSNGAQVSAKAVSFIEALKSVDTKTLSVKENEAFAILQPKLANDAIKIAESKKIEDQRNAFASFSNNMWDLLKSGDHFDEPVYQQYCPMKKSYWISKESNIKNPYFGKQMLTCGKTTETLK